MNIIKNATIIGLSLLIIQAISSIAYANPKESLMAALDIDQDGLISLKEAAVNADLLNNFNLIDTNSDGYISMDELLASDITEE